MKRKIAALLLMFVLPFCLLCGCNTQTKLVGTWNAKTETSILGVSIETPTVSEGVVTFSFEKDGTGTMATDFGSVVPATSRAYTYSVDKSQLTLTYDSGSIEVYTFTLEKDVLTLDGRVNLELNRAS